MTQGPARMTRGVMSGNGRYVQVFSGNLGEGELRGKYVQFVTSIGQNGCSAPIRFYRHADSDG